MTSSKVYVPVGLPGSCVHATVKRGSKGKSRMKCAKGHTLKNRDLIACRYYEPWEQSSGQE